MLMMLMILMISDLNTMKMIREDVTVMPPMQPVASGQILTPLWVEVGKCLPVGTSGTTGILARAIEQKGLSDVKLQSRLSDCDLGSTPGE